MRFKLARFTITEKLKVDILIFLAPGSVKIGVVVGAELSYWIGNECYALGGGCYKQLRDS